MPTPIECALARRAAEAAGQGASGADVEIRTRDLHLGPVARTGLLTSGVMPNVAVTCAFAISSDDLQNLSKFATVPHMGD